MCGLSARQKTIYQHIRHNRHVLLQIRMKTDINKNDFLTLTVRLTTAFSTGRFALLLAASVLTAVVLLSCLTTATAQSSVTLPENPLVRFDGRDVLFLGLSEKAESHVSTDHAGYYIVTLPCKGSTSERPRYYRFAVATPNGLERDLLTDSADGRWQQWDIISAALVAEGLTDRKRVDSYHNKVATIVRQLPSQTASSKADLARSVFETMHKQLLVGKYDIACTNLAQTIDAGDFNCVSATVLFHAMAQQAGLDVSGLEMKGHALSRVRVDNQIIDLETTCGDWFKLSEHERTRPHDLASAGYDTVYSVARRNAESIELSTARLRNQTTTLSNPIDPADLPPRLSPNEVPSNLREISDVQLIATIYYNRGVDELTAGRFSTATAFNVKALQLDPHNENAWRNLMATLNNWAIARASKGDHINAAQLLDEGRLIDNEYELFTANQIHTYYHWIAAVADRRDYETAITLLQLAEERLPNQPNLRFLNYTIRRKMANEFFETRDDHKAFEQFDIAAEIAPSDINVAEAEITDVARHVRQLIDRNNLSRAIWLIDRELARQNVNRTNTGSTNVDASQFAVQLPDAPEVSPVFSRPLVLDDAEANESRIPVVVTPISEKPVANTPPHVVARPNSTNSVTDKRAALQKVAKMAELNSLRGSAVVTWANESLRQRDYPEAIRRLTIGEPPRDQMSVEQIKLLRRTCDDWLAALRAENRHEEVKTLLHWVAESPYLAEGKLRR